MNIGSAHIQGVETELTLRLAHWLVLQANYSLDTAFALVILLILALLSLGLFWLIEVAQRKLAPWSAEVRQLGFSVAAEAAEATTQGILEALVCLEDKTKELGP